jgi:peptide/nickel transport system permease protein
MSLKQRPYVDLAITSDMGDIGIIFGEILPNLLPYIGVGLAVTMGAAMLAEAGLALIGIGLGGGNIATLGQMIYLAMQWGAMGLGKWQLIFPPIIILVLIFVSLNFINIGLEQAFNPRLRAVTGA